MEGHICPVPSVKEYLAEIGVKMISGKQMFLFGPTGTGKTSLARFAAKHFTGKEAEMVYCSPQTRESNIWGKTGLRPAEGEAGRHGAIKTIDIYGPLAKAMKEGSVCIFDEFTALPREQQVFIKGIFNAKPGDKVNIVGNGQTEIKPGFQIILTANLKSEKNPERQELPPEIAREFEQNNLKIDYTPKDQAYDIMLARLMNKDGSLDMSYYDLNQTLPKLAEALEEIQIAYTGRTSEQTARLVGAEDASGKIPGLKKFVMTQGTVEAIIDDWKTEKSLKHKNICFAEFLDQALRRGLTFEEYPEKDRILAAKILASKGFLTTLSAEDLNLPQSVFDISIIKKIRGEKAIKQLREKSSAERHILISELVKVDPFGRRQQKAAEMAGEFLAGDEEYGKETKAETDLEKAREIIGKENFYGPDEIEKAFGFMPERVPPVPFSKQELEKAKEMNLKLVYYPQTNGKGEQLTVETIAGFSQNNTAQNKGKLLYEKQFGDNMQIFGDAWLKNDAKTMSAPVASGWQLVSENILEKTENQNYKNQTKILVEKYEESFPNNLPIDWDKIKADFDGLADNDSEQLGKNKLSQILREPYTNTIFRYLLIEKLTKRKILINRYSWSSTVSSGGALVHFGGAVADGAGVYWDRPGGDWGSLGAVFSRSENLTFEI